MEGRIVFLLFGAVILLYGLALVLFREWGAQLLKRSALQSRMPWQREEEVWWETHPEWFPPIQFAFAAWFIVFGAALLIAGVRG